MSLYSGLENPYRGLAKFDSKDLPFVVARGLELMQGRADANETGIFARQLEYIFTQTYDVLRPEFKARQLIPVDTRVPSGADSFTYSTFDKLGEAEFVHNYAQDFANADIVGKQTLQKIVSIGASYQYSVQDMRAAAMAGLPLETRKAEAARYAMELKLENLACLGDTSTGLVGLSNATGIGAVTKVSQNNAGATSSTWSTLITDALAKGNITAVAQEILKDINLMQKTIFVNSNGIHTPDTLVLTVGAYGVLASTPMAPQFGQSDSILQYVMKMSPWLKSVEYWVPLGTAGALTNSVTGRQLCYKKDPTLLSLIISQEFEQFAPQPRNMSWIVPCHMRTGAVEVRYPVSVAYMDGANA